MPFDNFLMGMFTRKIINTPQAAAVTTVIIAELIIVVFVISVLIRSSSFNGTITSKTPRNCILEECA